MLDVCCRLQVRPRTRPENNVGVGPGGAIVYFAAPTTDDQQAARFLSGLLTAHAANKPVLVRYNLDDNGSAFSCALVDCRPLLNVIVID